MCFWLFWIFFWTTCKIKRLVQCPDCSWPWRMVVQKRFKAWKKYLMLKCLFSFSGVPGDAFFDPGEGSRSLDLQVWPPPQSESQGGWEVPNSSVKLLCHITLQNRTLLKSQKVNIRLQTNENFPAPYSSKMLKLNCRKLQNVLDS